MEQWLRVCEQDDQRRFEMLTSAITDRRVLDFGCGAGGFVRKAHAVAAEAVGVELERRVREYWTKQLPIHASLEEAGAGYDVITAFHVIEHLPDPRAMLRDLAARLALGGRLVLEVPSSDDALLTLYDNEAFQHFTYWSQHLYLFNAQTLLQLVVQAGLRVVAIQQFQRYSAANHLHWLSKGRPGGHQHWAFLDTPELTQAYASSLAAIGRCDTLIAHLEGG
jgi:2-polyprenyl-3-methyl-5-hydroxy-6-metoxy-1,4-benzoquinol methylase